MDVHDGIRLLARLIAETHAALTAHERRAAAASEAGMSAELASLLAEPLPPPAEDVRGRCYVVETGRMGGRL